MSLACTVDGCERKLKYTKTGWCQTHYHRWWRNGDHTVVRDNSYEDPYRLVYRSAHGRVRRLWGSAEQYECMRCGSPAKEWAYDGTDSTEKSEDIRGQYPVVFSVHPEFYFPACYPCHRLMDAGNRSRRRTHCKYGHELTEENTYSALGTNDRECRTCRHQSYLERRRRLGKL